MRPADRSIYSFKQIILFLLKKVKIKKNLCRGVRVGLAVIHNLAVVEERLAHIIINMNELDENIYISERDKICAEILVLRNNRKA